MIVSTNGDSHRREFERLLNGSQASMTKDANNFRGHGPQQFEHDVKDIMDVVAKGTPFQGTLILRSGGVFPDIYTDPRKFPFGVEVKTTQGNKWTTVGNSVLESTRVEGIDHIYIFFGKLAPPVGFMCRRYEDCISGVAVTHSPRYLIDMRLDSGDTVFDKMRVPYEVLRKKGDPIAEVKKYYRTAFPGESLWWLDSGGEEPPAASVVIRFWQSLERSEQEEFMVRAMALFPRIFKEGDHAKYSDLAAWLISKHSVLITSLRDLFSAGGQLTIREGTRDYRQVPRVIGNLRERLPGIGRYLRDSDNLPEIEECWARRVRPAAVVETWIRIVEANNQAFIDRTGFPLRQMITENIG